MTDKRTILCNDCEKCEMCCECDTFCHYINFFPTQFFNETEIVMIIQPKILFSSNWFPKINKFYKLSIKQRLQLLLKISVIMLSFSVGALIIAIGGTALQFWSHYSIIIVAVIVTLIVYIPLQLLGIYYKDTHIVKWRYRDNFVNTIDVFTDDLPMVCTILDIKHKLVLLKNLYKEELPKQYVPNGNSKIDKAILQLLNSAGGNNVSYIYSSVKQCESPFGNIKCAELN